MTRIRYCTERRGRAVVSPPARHAADRGAIPGPGARALLGVKTWLSTLETVYLCLSDETLKAVGHFYLVSMPGEVKYPTQEMCNLSWTPPNPQNHSCVSPKMGCLEYTFKN